MLNRSPSVEYQILYELWSRLIFQSSPRIHKFQSMNISNNLLVNRLSNVFAFNVCNNEGELGLLDASQRYLRKGF